MLGIRPLLQVPPRDLPVGEVIDDERGDLTLARRHASSAPECLPGSSGSSSRTVTTPRGRRLEYPRSRPPPAEELDLCAAREAGLSGGGAVSP
jgi:hypothetical protein